MLQCQKQSTSKCQLSTVDSAAYQTLGISDAKLLLSPSCKHCLSEWQRISVIVIEKQSTHVVRSVFSGLCGLLFTFQLLCLLLSVALMVSWHWDILY